MTLADAGYFAANHLAECGQRGQQVVSEARQRSLTDAYHKDRFTYYEQSDSFSCPQGRRLKFLRIQHTNGVPLRLYPSLWSRLPGVPSPRRSVREPARPAAVWR